MGCRYRYIYIYMLIVSIAESDWCFFLFSQFPSHDLGVFQQGENKDGPYLADGALVMFPSSSEDLSTWMRRAHACRATSATEVAFGWDGLSGWASKQTSASCIHLFLDPFLSSIRGIRFCPLSRCFFHDDSMKIEPFYQICAGE